MANILSFLFGILALVFIIPGLIPILGALNWIGLPFAAVGLLLGVISSSNSGRNFNIAVMAISVVRLWLGGGIL